MLPASEKDEIEELTTRLSIEQLDEILKSGAIGEKDTEIIKAKFGYGNKDEPRSYQEVADMFGYRSKQTIINAEGRAIKKLRRILISTGNKKDFCLNNRKPYEKF